MKTLVIGGTGTLGRAVVKELSSRKVPLVIFSRGELEQQKMKAEYPQCEYIIGDVRDIDALYDAMRGCRDVFHLAALKHIDVAEANVAEALKTNVEGTFNVANVAIDTDVRNLIFSSTDKAVNPINVYGMTKAIAEAHLRNLQRKKTPQDPNITIFRWGNVIGSRGSAVPLFIRQMLLRKPLKITHSDMTRFWIRIDDAAKFMCDRFNEILYAPEAVIPEMKAASVIGVIEAIKDILGIDSVSFETIGIRPGEKLHEEIIPGMNSLNYPQYTHEELKELLLPVVMEHANA